MLVKGPPILRSLMRRLLLGSHAAESRTWTEEKRARHGQAWIEVPRRQGTDGPSVPFLAAHGARRSPRGAVGVPACSTAPADALMADLMTVLALNAGMSGTVFPVICRS